MIHLSVVLPIYNEEDRLGRSLAKLVDFLWHYTHYKFEIVCVLNGCTDASAEIVRQFQEHWPQIRSLELQERGKGLAVRSGMLAATGKYRYMADVDLSTPVEEIPRFLASIRNADLVAGVRTSYLPLLRQIAHEGFALLSSRLTSVRDSQCGFKMFRDTCAMDVFSRCKVDGWAFDVEALYIAKALQYRVWELEVAYTHNEQSKCSPFRDALGMAWAVMNIKRSHPEIIALSNKPAAG
jgi:dolichyl-phosphate beta-glucosyltransferase